MNAPFSLPDIKLTDKYTQESGRVYVTGQQAIIRMMLKQRKLDQKNGLNTAGFVSGYRGSPMTAIDVELWRAGEALLEDHHVKFWPGLNENLAMTSVWGTQQVGFQNDAKYDGVYAMWYGKGPGLDQTIDGLRQATLYGTRPHGGVLVMVGDDPEMRSTVDPYHSELLFEDLLMPVLYPADIQEAYDFGFYGFALSRFCGAFVGYKLLPETIETAASIDADYERIKINLPDYAFPEDGVNARDGDSMYLHEDRTRNHKLPAAIAFARANNLNRVTHSSRKKKLGIAAMGKTWRDVLQALHDLGVDEGKAKSLGIHILKVAMPFPSDDNLYREFATGMDEILIVEDKREQIENGFKRGCFHLPASKRPVIVGRLDENDKPLVPVTRELTPDIIAKVIAARLSRFHKDEKINRRLEQITTREKQMGIMDGLSISRVPYFCSGCPHNSSTLVPEGSLAFGGVGCHFMAAWMNRSVKLYTHMGAEGAPWIGQAPFVDMPHVFQQLGDGTYFHSGSLAIRAAVSAEVNMTYKILFNDAVAMTGGQPVDGVLTVPMITHHMYHEGVKKTVVVSDEPEKYNRRSGLAPDTKVYHRRDLDKVQRQLRDIKGVTVLIYDQTCAAEKRRRRKKGTFPDPPKRAFINERVCEGCGDCSKKSNCLSVQPIDTEYGRKRKIHQSSCNKDYSCVDGFCPSFVTVHGGQLRKGKAKSLQQHVLPLPDLPVIAPGDTYGALLAGIGGTGVVTIGALLGMAAHLEGKGVSIVDQLGFSQKGGPVITHLRFGNQQNDINRARLNIESCDLLIACDMLTAGGPDVIKTLSKGRTKAFLNLEPNISGDFIQNPDAKYPTDKLKQRFSKLLNPEDMEYIEASKLAVDLLGDAIGANLFLVGYAWQKGAIPVSEQAIKKAIEINGVKPDWNKQAFDLGRRVAHDPSSLETLTTPSNNRISQSVEELIKDRHDELIKFQNKTYADQYTALVQKVSAAENDLTKGFSGLTEAVARYAYKLMAYKDEYEVARLQTAPDFKLKLEENFEGNYKLKYHLSPPLFARKDPHTGLPRKYEFGGWVRPLFQMLARMKFLRGTAFDAFGYTAERKMERSLISTYETTIDRLIENLSPDNHAMAIEIASLPDKIRGYGHIKEKNVEDTLANLEVMMERYQSSSSSQSVA